MKPTYSRLLILIALIIGLLLVGSVCAAEQENVTLEITPEATLQVIPEVTAEITQDVTPEITLEITPDLKVTELFAAEDLPALEAAGDPLEANFTQNRTYGPAPLPIQFYDRSTGTPSNWSWDFGDGATSDLKNPRHTYASAGTYTVTLVVSDGVSSDSYEVTDRIRADNPVAPVAALSANKTSWSSPAAVQFYDRSTGYPTSWAWDFGDGVTATIKNPVHTYAATGNYTVTLTATNDLGSDTKVQTEYFHAYDPVVPMAVLSANKTSWSSPTAVQFYDRSTGFPTSWSWDFGDGATATIKNPVHTYTATGNYTVTLSVTNDLGSDTKVQTEYFHAFDPVAPVAALSANKSSWSSPAAVQFYDRSTGFPTSWSWDFGDGATSTVKNPVHTYAATGNYTVTLTATNDLGSDTKVQTEYFHAFDPVAPVAALSANKTSWSAPATIQFYDRSTGFPTSWTWDFGDGATSTVKNPVHTFEATGNYTVTLTATNDLGTDTKVQTDYFHAYNSVAPVAAISANKTSWSAPATIQFYDRSTGFPTSWTWDFGDGATSTVKNPVHTFEATGNYTVTLTATNDLGSDTKTATDYIIVSVSSAPIAAISANKTSWSSPAAIQFYDRSAGFPTAWQWDFGDGATATIKNPVHTYTATGNYTVNLTVTNEVGSDTKVALDYIKVSGSSAPVATISANKTSWSSPAAIQFYDRSTGFPTAWAWDFGDGTTATVKNPVHTYTGSGNYTVNLTVTNEVGPDTKVMPDYIRVSAPEIPLAKLSANRTAGPAPIVIQFYDRSTGFPTEWLWDFGDGTNSTLKNPVHAYSYGGNYTISLTAANALGNTSVTALNYIKASGTGPTPVVTAAFTANATAGTAPFAVAFTDLSTGSPTIWNWSFGDGTFADVQNPVHTYAGAGNFTVSLAASNAGSSDSRTITEYIIVQQAGPAFDAEIIFNSMPTTMFQGEHYIVDIKVNNTGTKTWYADPASANLVFLQGLGDASGNATKFNITHIPMLFENETVAPGESYDFFFYVRAPDNIGNYTPEYQVSSSAAGGTFGPVADATVNVIENPFHPVLQPDGSKLYTTTFGNTSSGVSVNIVGPRVYIDDIKASSFNDPRFLINPALKSGVFNLELNESFTYADVAISYDPAKTSTPSNLALGYFNETSGNYTFIPSTVDTTSHTVTSRVTPADLAMSGSSLAALDPVQYHALPAKAQNEMGYMDIGANDNWTIYPPVDSYATTSFGNGASFPPGNYTILTSGTYTSYYVQYIGCVNWVGADSNPDNTYGYYVNFNNPAGGYKQVQKLRVSSGTLKIDHKGGPISVYHSHIVNGVCGSVGYRLYYGDGPVFRDGDYDFRNELNNDEFNATELGYDVAVTAYQAVAGCVLGQAGKKGGYLDSVHSAIPGWNDYINDDVTESPAYLVGQVACGIAFPYATLARDFSADLLRGDYAGAALNSLGYLGPVKTILRNSDVIPAFLIKNSKNAQTSTKLTKYLVDNGLLGASHDEAIGTLDKVFAGSASRLINPVKNTADDLVNAALKGFDLKTVRGVENINGNTRVLTETRYAHILDRHVTGSDPGSGSIKTSFFPLGKEVRPGVVTPNVMTETDLSRLISNSQKYGTPTEEAGDLVYRWNPNEFGITDMKTVVKKETGEIVTSYPIDGPNVIKVF